MAERDGALVGLLVLHLSDDHLLLDNVAVAPSARRLGIGSLLLDHTGAAGAAEVRPYTNTAMTENLADYARRGHRETHRAVQDGFHRVYFTRSLAPGRGR